MYLFLYTDVQVAVPLVRETMYAVVHLSATEREREEEREKETRNHSTGTFTGTVADAYIYFNLQQNVSADQFFSILIEVRVKNNNMRREKIR